MPFLNLKKKRNLSLSLPAFALLFFFFRISSLLLLPTSSSSSSSCFITFLLLAASSSCAFFFLRLLCGSSSSSLRRCSGGARKLPRRATVVCTSTVEIMVRTRGLGRALGQVTRRGVGRGDHDDSDDAPQRR
ncbi:hypothetical protein D0Y65_024550 [Glycine soja]|uniref:Uncharacterized protein n=1 Tax=Glycine soja TaxID=3848 RepID=A0A445J2P8_GLYSO|nr:hypothetical protein D0Y65_024550 [Glycine soja]